MTPERWRQIEELYQVALERDAGERAAFLKEACHGDDEMKREIESLLSHEGPAEQFLEAPGVAVLAKAMAGERTGSMIGRRIGPYQILSLLGVGGMGEVYQARDTRLGRLVALKILPFGMPADPERKRRFLQEAKAVSAINHPHIVTLYDMGSEDGIDFLVMEYVEGKTLDKLISDGGLDLKKALQCAVEIADAFAKAHAAGIIHRDLKPGNIMLTGDGAVKVLDFGIAKLTETSAAGEPGITMPAATTTGGMILGTGSYMSPEQAEGKKTDARSDIFSFGALLYEMVTGQRAFHGDTTLSTLSAILHKEPTPPGQLVKGLPPELERVIARCLRKDPERRWQTVEELKVALADLQEALDSERSTRAAHSDGRRWQLVWATVLLGAVGCGVLWFLSTRTKAPEATLTAVPLTAYSGYQSEPTFSPDGNQVAFTWDGESQQNKDIYVKLVGSGGPPLRLTTDPAADYSPAWSPDGRFIAFLRDLPTGKVAVLLIPPLGGPERMLAEIIGRAGLGDNLPGPDLAWSPDGNWLVIGDRDSPRGAVALFLLSIETGEKRRLTNPPAQLFGDSGPAFSPDGHWLAFSRSVDYAISDLYLLALSDGFRPAGDPRRITFGIQGAASPSWSADGREIIFASGPLDQYSLLRIDVSRSRGRGAEPQRLASLGTNLGAPAISRRGQRLAYQHWFLHQSIWQMAAPSTSNAGRSKEKAAKPLISSSRDDMYPQFSPDGKRIAYVSTRSGHDEVWVCDNNGSNAVQLTSFGGPDVSTPRWSPDGDRIAFDSDVAGEFDIFVVGANGGKPRRMTTHPANDGNPSWSRDGGWIYFDSARTGEHQIFKIPATGGEAIQLTRDGGFAPRESPDGRFLYYTKSLAATSLWRVPLGAGQATKVLDGLSNYVNMAIVDGGIYYVPAHDSAVGSIRFLNFANNRITTIASFQRPLSSDESGGLSVSPDGRSILYTQVEQAGSELMLVENFR